MMMKLLLQHYAGLSDGLLPFHVVFTSYSLLSALSLYSPLQWQGWWWAAAASLFYTQFSLFSLSALSLTSQ